MKNASKNCEIDILKKIFPNCKPQGSSKTITWTLIEGTRLDVCCTIKNAGWIETNELRHSEAAFVHKKYPNLRIALDYSSLKPGWMNVMVVTPTESKV
jgi:hypothetical protein